MTINGDVRRHDSRLDAVVYHIAPYGRISLGRGVSTFTLLKCDAVAVQLVCEQVSIRFNEGATLPAKGVQRWIRNPYSRAVRVELLEDLPVNISARHTETDIGFVGAHASRFSHSDLGPIVGKRTGLVIMAERGDAHYNLEGYGGIKFSLIPDAKMEYKDLLPAGVLATESHPIDGAGIENPNYTVRSGVFTDTEMGQWIADSGWNRAPVEISNNNGGDAGVLKHGTALVAAGIEGAGFKARCTITDLGDWENHY